MFFLEDTVRFLIKLSLICLVVGLLVGLWLAAHIHGGAVAP